MSWDAVAAFAEVLGAIAVIVSVLYLAAQVRHGAADVRATIIHSLHAKEVDIAAIPAGNPILAAAIEKVHLGEELTDDERATFTMWMYAQWVNFQQMLQEYQRLDIDDEVLEAERRRLAGGMRPPLARAIWRRLKDRYTPEFIQYVEEKCMPGTDSG